MGARQYKKCAVHGDETVVEGWVQNLSGESECLWNFPCDPSDRVHFCHRTGREEVKKIFQLTVHLHGRPVLEDEVVVDTTVQEK